MRLRDVQAPGTLDVTSDGDFASLGLLSHSHDKMLVVLYDETFLPSLYDNQHVSCVITRPDLLKAMPDRLGVAVSEDPQASFYKVHDFLLKQTDFYGKTFDTEIAVDADVHPTAWVDGHNVRIGPRSRIGPRAVILEQTTIGEDVFVGPGVIIGAEGFEPKFVGGQHVLIPHAGGVRLHDGVHILAQSHVARAVFTGCTEIGNRTKVDALVHVSHNVKIGCDCEIAAGAIVAGSTTVGDRVWIGPGAVVSSEVQIGDRSFVAIGSVVTKHVPLDDRVFGVPAKSIKRTAIT